MDPLTLLLLAFSWGDVGNDHPPGFKYPALPTEKVCQLCFHQAEADSKHLGELLEVVTGWRRYQTLEAKNESDKLVKIWYAAWWVTWNRPLGQAYQGYDQLGNTQAEWAERLQEMIGVDNFWQGRIAFPLSLR